MAQFRQCLASNWGAPAAWCRTTIMSGFIDCRFFPVSIRDSPLTTLLLETLKLIVSALSRFAAISNDERVRVEGSKKRLITVRPLSVGTFLIGREKISRKLRAVFRISSISAGDSSAIPSRCLVDRGIVL